MHKFHEKLFYSICLCPCVYIKPMSETCMTEKKKKKKKEQFPDQLKN